MTASLPAQKDRAPLDLLLHAQVLPDTADQLRITDVLAADAAGQFVPWASGAVRANVFWLKLTLDWDRRFAASQYLLVNPATLARLDLYRKNLDGYWVALQSGTSLPVDLRDMAYRLPVFHLEDMRQTGNESLYLRVQSDFGVLHSIQLYDTESFFSRAFRQQVWLGIFFGVCSLLILAAFLFDRAEKEWIYQLFAWYVIGCTCKALIEYGVFHQYLPTDNLAWRTFHYIVPLALITNMVGIRLMLHLFGIAPQKHTGVRYFLRCSYASTLIMFCLSVVAYSETIATLSFFLISFVIMPSTFFMSRHVALQGETYIRVVYYLGLCLTTLIAAEYAAMYLGVAALGYAGYAVPMTMLLLQLAIFYGISRRFQVTREEKERAHKETLSIIANSQQQLERRVIAKTRNLRMAMQQVQQVLIQEKKTYEEQKNFIAMVSHELRTPLAVIDATAQNMARESAMQNHAAELSLTRIQLSTEYIADFVREYLEGKSHTMMRDNLHHEWVLLTPLLTEALDMIAPLASMHQLHISLQSVPEKVYADKALLRLLLRTLLDILLKSTTKDSSVTISADATNDGWSLVLHIAVHTASDASALIPANDLFSRRQFDLIQSIAEMSAGQVVCEQVPEHGYRISVLLRYPAMKVPA